MEGCRCPQVARWIHAGRPNRIQDSRGFTRHGIRRDATPAPFGGWETVTGIARELGASPVTELRRWRSFVAKRQREARCITTTTPFGARRRQRRRTLGSGDGRWLCGGRAANRTRRRLRRHGAPCRLALARLRAWVPPPPNRGWGRQGMVRRRKTARAFRW